MRLAYRLPRRRPDFLREIRDRRIAKAAATLSALILNGTPRDRYASRIERQPKENKRPPETDSR
jgi:hypothetical protein